MSKEIVVRFSCNAGRSRLNLSPTATFQELQEKVQVVTTAEPAAQRLAFDEKGQRLLSGAPTASLASLGIVNGTQVYLLNAKAEVSVKAQVLTKVPVPVESEKTVPATAASTPGASSTELAKPAASASAGGEQSHLMMAERGPLSESLCAITPTPSDKGSKKDSFGNVLKDQGELDRNIKWEPFDAHIRKRQYETIGLRGGRVHTSTHMKQSGGMNKMPPPVSIMQQPYRHVDQISFGNIEEIQYFMADWMGKFIPKDEQRVGWLYGYYLEDNNYGEKEQGDGSRAVVEAIYEPPQKMISGECVMEDDPFKPKVDKIAEALGLECVGSRLARCA